jgi:hypothetical protein
MVVILINFVFARRAKVVLSSIRRMEDHRCSPPSLSGETYNETAGVMKAPPVGLENSCS